jgi:hypothetical protein
MSWKVDSDSADKEMACFFLWNPKVEHGVHKNQPLGPIVN